jgi:hypothetical protein
VIIVHWPLVTVPYNTYHATLWPGNSVTILFYGDSASLKLAPKPQGLVKQYSFVSIDGGTDVRYEVPNFDRKTKHHYVPIELTPSPTTVSDSQTRWDSGGSLKPHTLRITSISSTPISFEGLTVTNTLITQRRRWIEQQSHRQVIEFIGEGLDAERPGGFLRTDPYNVEQRESAKDALMSTIHYRLAERIGVLHSHMAANVCLLSSCNIGTPGLETQYFYTSPRTARPYSATQNFPIHLQSADPQSPRM